MKYFRIDISKPEVHLYPLVCWHVGAKQSSEKFIAEVVRQIKADPLAKAIYMGDAGECVTKMSKGNIYEQLLSPGDQLRVAVDLMSPIKDKLLFGVRGNHGNRIDKETGVGWDEILCQRLGMPYMGVSCLGDVVLKGKKGYSGVSLYCHHGTSGATNAGGKFDASRRPAQLTVCDIAITAHHHAAGETMPQHWAVTDVVNNRFVYHTMRMFMAGSAYDSRSGYAEEKQFGILLPEHIVITIKGTDIDYRSIKGFDPCYISEEEGRKWRL